MQIDRKAIVGEGDNHSLVATPGPRATMDGPGKPLRNIVGARLVLAPP